MTLVSNFGLVVEYKELDLSVTRIKGRTWIHKLTTTATQTRWL